MSVLTHPSPRRTRAVRILAEIGLVVCVLVLLRVLAQALPGAEEARGMLGPVFFFFNAQPFVLIFLTVAAGYGLGRVKFGTFNLGATAATLLICLGLSLW